MCTWRMLVEALEEPSFVCVEWCFFRRWPAYHFPHNSKLGALKKFIQMEVLPVVSHYYVCTLHMHKVCQLHLTRDTHRDWFEKDYI